MALTKKEQEQYYQFLDEFGNEDLAFMQYTRWKVLTDLFWFGYEFFGWKNAIDPRNKRRKRIDTVFHKWLAAQIQQPGDKLILVPRLHLKSTWVKLDIVRNVLLNPNARIGLFSVASRLVEKELVEIKHMFSRPELRELFPDIVPDPGKEFRGWQKCTANELTLKRDSSDGEKIHQESQITVLGSGARMAGLHMDKAYLDDIVDQDSVKTPELIKKTLEWWGYIQSIMELGAEYTITGTRYGRFDLYSTLMAENQVEHVVVRKAIEDGKVLYSSWFTKKELAKIKRRQGNHIFSCQYLLDPIAQEDKIFPGVQPTYNRLPAGEYTWYMAIDPAPTVEAYSDETGIAIGALDKQGFLWIDRAIGVKKTGGPLCDLLIKLAKMYKFHRIGIEYGLQTHLQYILDNKLTENEHLTGERTPFNCVPIPISRKLSKGDRVNLTLGSFVREGKVHIKDTEIDLIHEMDFFTGRGKEKDNLVDAASMLFYVIEDFNFGYMQRLDLKPKGTFFDIFKDSKTDGYKWRDVFKHGKAV